MRPSAAPSSLLGSQARSSPSLAGRNRQPPGGSSTLRLAWGPGAQEAGGAGRAEGGSGGGGSGGGGSGGGGGPSRCRPRSPAAAPSCSGRAAFYHSGAASAAGASIAPRFSGKLRWDGPSDSCADHLSSCIDGGSAAILRGEVPSCASPAVQQGAAGRDQRAVESLRSALSARGGSPGRSRGSLYPAQSSVLGSPGRTSPTAGSPGCYPNSRASPGMRSPACISPGRVSTSRSPSAAVLAETPQRRRPGAVETPQRRSERFSMVSASSKAGGAPSASPRPAGSPGVGQAGGRQDGGGGRQDLRLPIDPKSRSLGPSLDRKWRCVGSAETSTPVDTCTSGSTQAPESDFMPLGAEWCSYSPQPKVWAPVSALKRVR